MDEYFQQYLNMMLNPQSVPTPVATTQVAAPVVAPVAQPLPTPVVTPTVDPVAAKRNELRGQVESTFGPNYGQKNIASSLLDDTINSILSEQKNDASTYLDRGRKRGIYNDTGYNAGLARVGSAYEAGSAKLHSLGNSVIDKYRADADTIRDKAYNAAAGYNEGNSFSLDPYIEQGNDVISRAKNFGGGDLRNAFGGTQLFDFGDLNNRAGQAQGAVNMRDNDVLGAISSRRRANSFGRGLGSHGAF